MKYYLLSCTTDKEIGSAYPQGVCTDKENKVIRFDVKHSIMTDMISAVNVDDNDEIILSDRAISLLKEFFNEHVIIKPIIFTNIIASYYSVFFTKGIEDCIDFPKSEFGIYSGRDKIASLNVNSYSDYIRIRRLVFMGEYEGYSFGSIVHCSIICFKYDPSVSISSVETQFPLYKYHGLMINESFKDTILKNKLTGFRFDEFDYVI